MTEAASDPCWLFSSSVAHPLASVFHEFCDISLCLCYPYRHNIREYKVEREADITESSVRDFSQLVTNGEIRPKTKTHI